MSQSPKRPPTDYSEEEDESRNIMVFNSDHFKTMSFPPRPLPGGSSALETPVDEQGMQTHQQFMRESSPNQMAAQMQPSVPASQPNAYGDQDAYLATESHKGGNTSVHSSASKSSLSKKIKGKVSASTGAVSKNNSVVVVNSGPGAGLNTSSQTLGANRTNSNASGQNTQYQYQLLGIGRTMNRIDKLVRPASVLSNDRKQASTQKRTTTANYNKAPYGIQTAQANKHHHISNVGKHIEQQQQLKMRQQELELAASALEKAKQNSTESYKKKIALMNQGPSTTAPQQPKGTTSNVNLGSSIKVTKSMSFHGSTKQISASSAKKDELKKSSLAVQSQPRVSITTNNTAKKLKLQTHKQRSADEHVEKNILSTRELDEQFEQQHNLEPIDIALQVHQQASLGRSSTEEVKFSAKQSFQSSQKFGNLRMDQSSLPNVQLVDESNQEILSSNMRKFEIDNDFGINMSANKEHIITSPPGKPVQQKSAIQQSAQYFDKQGRSVNQFDDKITIDLSSKRSSLVEAGYAKKVEPSQSAQQNETRRSHKSGSVAYYGQDKSSSAVSQARKRTSYKAPTSQKAVSNSGSNVRKDLQSIGKGTGTNLLRNSRASAAGPKSSTASGRPQSSGAGSLAGDSTQKSQYGDQRVYATKVAIRETQNSQKGSWNTSSHQAKTALRLSQPKKVSVATRNKSPSYKTVRSKASPKAVASKITPQMTIETGPSIAIQPSGKELEALRKLVENFDFDIFNSQVLVKQQSSNSDDKQVGGFKPTVNEDMLPYSVFQRFCVLLLAVHGQVEKYSSTDASGDRTTDTTTFLKQLNVYSAIVNIDETIRERRYNTAQLEILMRDEPLNGEAPLPQLQVFINAAVAYALSLTRDHDERFDEVPGHTELSKTLKIETASMASRNALRHHSKTLLEQKSTSTKRREIEEPLDLKSVGAAQGRADFRTEMKSQHVSKGSMDMMPKELEHTNQSQSANQSYLNQAPMATLPVHMIKSSSKANLHSSKDAAPPLGRGRIKSSLTTSKTQAEFAAKMMQPKKRSELASKQSVSSTVGSQSPMKAVKQSTITRAKHKINTILSNQEKRKQSDDQVSQKQASPARQQQKRPAHTKKLRQSFGSSFGSPSMRPANSKLAGSRTPAQQEQDSVLYNADLNVVPSQSNHESSVVHTEDSIALQAPATTPIQRQPAADRSQRGLYSAMQAMKKTTTKSSMTSMPKPSSFAQSSAPSQKKGIHATADRSRQKTFSLAQANNALAISSRTIDASRGGKDTASPARSVKPYQSTSPKKKVRKDPKARSVVYEPVAESKAQEQVAHAMQFFQQQCLDDSDYVEDEYIFEIARLPRTTAEADRMAKRFQEDADRWNNYVEGDDEDDDDVAGVVAAMGDNKDQKMGLAAQPASLLAMGEQGHSNYHQNNVAMSAEFLPRRDLNSQTLNRFSHIEKQHSDLQSKSPSQLAEQVLSSSNVNLAMIQKIKSYGAKAANSSDSLTMMQGARPSEKTNLGSSANNVFDYSRSGGHASSGMAGGNLLNQKNDNKIPGGQVLNGNEEDDLFERDSSSQI